MMLQRLSNIQLAIACFAFAAGCAATSTAWAHDGAHSSRPNSPAPGKPRSAPNNYMSPKDLRLNAGELKPLHGGQVTATKWHFFEVVYAPQETRIYVYSPSLRQLSPGRIHGEIVMRVKGNSGSYRYPLERSTDSQGKTYGVVRVNLSRVRDGDMQVTFKLLGLPFNQEERAEFTQVFSLTRPPIHVSVAAISEADRPFVNQQRVCPVTNTGLNNHGVPIKLIVGNQPLYVCCKGCIEKVQNNPQHFLTKAAAAKRENRQPSRQQVSVFWASQGDGAAIRAQRDCPVMNQPLGAHGKPLKVAINGRPVFVCCEGCIDKVVQGRDFYFRKLNDMAARNQPARPNPIGAQRRPLIQVGYATDADRPRIEAQATCLVLRKPLGNHGTPIKISIDGRPVFVCCQGCVKKVQDNPYQYLARLGNPQQTSPPAASTFGLFNPESSIGGSGGSCCAGK